MTGSKTTIVWFRRDLRLADNAALTAAARRGPVVPVFIWSPEEEQPWAPGAASRWWLHHSLAALRLGLEGRGVRLVVSRGPALAGLRALVRATGATAVYWNRLYEPHVVARDEVIKRALRDEDGLDVTSFAGALLQEPWSVLTKEEKPYQVFTPFWRAFQAKEEPPTCLAVPDLAGPAANPARKGGGEQALGLLPPVDWAGGLRAAWSPGEAGAQAMLAEFSGAVASYADGRDRPDRAGTSRLSPHLHFGEISPRQVWHAAKRAAGAGAEPYLRQLAWREFAHQLLHHFPRTDLQPLRPEFRKFPWARRPDALEAWQTGRTGFPIVDAGMRELWTTGWMHNRVRMIVASFLVKDLLIPWQDGARWFWDTLVDADLANNTLGWQWTAGCGADAAPYFRIFNPASQAAKFDPEGVYIRRWLPGLKAWPTDWLHDPERAEGAPRRAAGYPAPIVDHAQARADALGAYRAMRTG